MADTFVQVGDSERELRLRGTGRGLVGVATSSLLLEEAPQTREDVSEVADASEGAGLSARSACHTRRAVLQGG